jgi:hypothetical protein
MKYDKPTTDRMNEFFRVCAVVMNNMSLQINEGKPLIEVFNKFGAEGFAAEVKGDMDRMGRLVANTLGYKDHIEKMIEQGMDKEAIERQMIEYVLKIRHDHEEAARDVASRETKWNKDHQ